MGYPSEEDTAFISD